MSACGGREVSRGMQMDTESRLSRGVREALVFAHDLPSLSEAIDWDVGHSHLSSSAPIISHPQTPHYHPVFTDSSAFSQRHSQLKQGATYC